MILRRWYHSLKKSFTTPSLVLMYHRVASPETDPWQLAVSVKHFEEQLQVLQKSGLVTSSRAVVEKLQSGNKMRPFILITFDDGYEDNYLEAKPLLEKYNLPATFFISTQHIGTKNMFWWDYLAYLLLEVPVLPPTLSIDIEGVKINFDLSQESVLTDALSQVHKEWNYTINPPSCRSQLFMEIWKLFTPLPYNKQQNYLNKLKHWAGLDEQQSHNSYSMSEQQLSQLASNNLFTIGAHTVTHPALSYHSKEFQYNEIEKCKQRLESISNTTINLLAYPSGKYNEETVNVLKELKFQAAFTTNPKAFNRNDDIHRIGRFQVNDWGKEKFELALRNWKQ